MKKTSIITVLLLSCLSFSFSQAPSDSITVKKRFGGYVFYQDDKMLNMRQLIKIMEPNELAYKEIKSARSANTIAMIFSYTGGFLIGYPLGTMLGGEEPNWTIAGIGAGLVAIAIPFGIKSNNHAKNAVDFYNRGLETGSFQDNYEFNLVLTGNGIGITLLF